MNKNTIQERIINGNPLSGADVAAAQRDNRSITLRHAWPNGTPPKIMSAVSCAAVELASEVGAKTGLPVEIRTLGGECLYEWDPNMIIERRL